ncbi:MAG: hypothetical protein UV08_C0007G0007 [Parcubacteria group bacterium GW2011_GWA2_42_18]|nr:MAG: hypothetical protein UV08_C0007G0007 [Parcubacteria group bacterium GW2011_GWA2_42_18]
MVFARSYEMSECNKLVNFDCIKKRLLVLDFPVENKKSRYYKNNTVIIIKITQIFLRSVLFICSMPVKLFWPLAGLIILLFHPYQVQVYR